MLRDIRELKGEEYAVARDRIFAAGDAIGVDFAVRP